MLPSSCPRLGAALAATLIVAVGAPLAHAEPAAHAEPPSKSAPGAGSRIGDCRPRDGTRLLLDFFALPDAPADSPDQALAAAQAALAKYKEEQRAREAASIPPRIAT